MTERPGKEMSIKERSYKPRTLGRFNWMEIELHHRIVLSIRLTEIRYFSQHQALLIISSIQVII